MSEKTTKKRNSSVPDMDDIPSIASDSDEEHYRSSRLQQATRVEFPTPPGVPSIVVRKPSTASSKRLSLPGWRRKKAPPPVLSISPSDSRAPTPSPLPEDPLLRSHPLVPAPALEGVRYLSHTFQFSADPSITTPPSIPNASAAAPRFAPRLHTTSTVSSLELAQLYATLRAKRSELRRKNAEIAELQTVAIAEIAEGKGRVTGFVLVGRRVGMLSGAEKIEGKTKEDLRWELLYQGGRRGGELRFWARVGALAVLMCILAVIPTALAVADAPALASMWVFMRPLLRHGTLPAGLATVVLPTVLLLLLHTLMVISVDYLSCSASISIARSRSLALRASLALSLLLVLFIVTFGAVTSAPASLRQGFHVVRSLADGAVATAPLLLSTSALAALVFPLWSLVRPLETASSKRQLTTAKTPRQRFLALKPAFLSPSAVLALPFFSLSGLVLVAILSPLSALPLVPFLILAALVARHNGLYRSLHSQEMHGTYLITLVTAASFLLPLQPLLLGLMLLAYRYFGQGAACLALSLLIALYLPFEQLRRARSGRVSKATQAALSTFQLNLRHGTTPLVREAGGGASHAQAPSRASALPPPRRSMASIFDLLDSRGFSSVPLSQSSRPSLPLPEPDVLDTFADAELASRLHPDAPPRLALRSAAGRDEVEGVEGRRTMYPPALVGERPTLWLPRDELAEEQAKELRGLYGMKVVWENSVELRRLEGVF
ncbi:hypothetical protein BCR35DRAFT_197141 [Leucosporidium creatinivorum]|uniref:Uncharacterized protein n=1 Tax=Leucosporidium creatinivorum TaxID=106004 RepID=A0A1Y2DPT7_9BASI|nr:hypothetical protein BCR35DRAFT_197141 [Leucosporidium creatinivorum]